MSLKQLMTMAHGACSAPEEHAHEPSRPASRLPLWVQLGCAVMRAGEVPKHVAFIMDGNRRFARARGVELCAGHRLGFDKLEQVLEWCLELGVEAVTVYAFSIDNFRRSAAEVAALMELAKEKFLHLQSENALVRRYGMRLQLLGDLSLVPHDVRREMEVAVAHTRGNVGPLLNVCFAYTSHFELLAATRALAARVSSGELAAADVCEEAVEAELLTARVHTTGASVPPVDLVVRTSGERRLSNFLMWQLATERATVIFTQTLWPAFSVRSLLLALLQFQHARAAASRRARARAPQHRTASAAAAPVAAASAAASSCAPSVRRQHPSPPAAVLLSPWVWLWLCAQHCVALLLSLAAQLRLQPRPVARGAPAKGPLKGGAPPGPSGASDASTPPASHGDACLQSGVVDGAAADDGAHKSEDALSSIGAAARRRR